jgi:CheY-like chemotaxis protein
VFLNLLANACRYTPSGGRIDLALEQTDGSVEVSVRDTGIGVDPALQRRIFDPFVQADTSLERGNTGLGVGLTLARQLVQLHGGEIGVHSEGVGHGSRFTVRLPVDASPQPADQAAVGGPSPASVPDAPVSILVADDNVDFATSLAEVLVASGYVVRVAHDGAAALRAAVDAVPRIAILDIGMPKLNGYDLARELRANPVTGRIKLIAITGWGQEADRQQARDAGFDLHLVKPVDPDVLMDAVREMAT